MHKCIFEVIGETFQLLSENGTGDIDFLSDNFDGYVNFFVKLIFCEMSN